MCGCVAYAYPTHANMRPLYPFPTAFGFGAWECHVSPLIILTLCCSPTLIPHLYPPSSALSCV